MSGSDQGNETVTADSTAWPKFYVHSDPHQRWYIQREENGIRIDYARREDGTAGKDVRLWHQHADSFVARGEWVEVSWEEATERMRR